MSVLLLNDSLFMRIDNKGWRDIAQIDPAFAQTRDQMPMAN